MNQTSVLRPGIPLTSPVATTNKSAKPDTDTTADQNDLKTNPRPLSAKGEANISKCSPKQFISLNEPENWLEI